MKITTQSMLDYFNDRLHDPELQQFLDQVFAATDELREAVGIEPDDQLRIPNERKSAALRAMWDRLFESSAHTACDHLLDRPIQPTVIADRRQMCGACWDAYEWKPLPDKMTRAEARELSCDCCGRRFESRWDNHDTGDGGIWAETWQWWNYIAPVRICTPCHRILNYSTEDLPPGIREGVADALRHQSSL